MEEKNENGSENGSITKMQAEFDVLKNDFNTHLNIIKDHLASAATSVNEINGHKVTALQSTNDTNVLKNETARIKTEVDTTNEEIQQTKSSIDQFLSAIESIKNEVETVKNHVNTTKTETESSKNSISQTKSDAETHLSTIQQLKGDAAKASSEINDLLTGLTEELKEGEPSKMKTLQNCYDTILKNKEVIDGVLAKITEYENHVFGTKENEKTSLKHRLSDFEIKNNAKFDEWNKSYDTLFNKIEGLLPGATSTGLAKAYEEQRKKHEDPNKNWSFVFMGATAGMIVFAICTFNVPTDFNSAINSILSKAPFFVPAVWLAVYASKQQSKSKRLEEEYAYKEALSKSYESYKREIDSLPNSPEKREILQKLLSAMIEMVKYNPSKTLQSKNHGDNPPVIDKITGSLLEKKDKGSQEEKSE